MNEEGLKKFNDSMKDMYATYGLTPLPGLAPLAVIPQINPILNLQPQTFNIPPIPISPELQEWAKNIPEDAAAAAEYIKTCPQPTGTSNPIHTNFSFQGQGATPGEVNAQLVDAMKNDPELVKALGLGTDHDGL